MINDYNPRVIGLIQEAFELVKNDESIVGSNAEQVTEDLHDAYLEMESRLWRQEDK